MREAVLDRAPMFLKGQLLPRTVKRMRAQPTPVRRAPVGGARIAHPVCKQKGFQPLPRLLQIVFGGDPRSRQIPECFVFNAGYIHRRQIARTQRAHKLDRITSIGLNAPTRLFGDHRGGTHHALESSFDQLAIETITARAGFIDDAYTARFGLKAFT